jgi:enoyl-CoA hydratase
MRTEFRIVSRIAEGHDFYEGVRASLIDKDGRPHWTPSSLDAVRREEIERYFGELGSRELKAA